MHYWILNNYKPVKWEGKTAVNGICAKRMCHDVNNMINSFGSKRLWQCKTLYYFELKFTMITAFMVTATMLFLCHWYFLHIHILEMLDTSNQILWLVKWDTN